MARRLSADSSRISARRGWLCATRMINSCEGVVHIYIYHEEERELVDLRVVRITDGCSGSVIAPLVYERERELGNAYEEI